ncbi:MAG: tetratricopeptide repeat protein [Ornithinimicrobium sp.]
MHPSTARASLSLGVVLLAGTALVGVQAPPGPPSPTTAATAAPTPGDALSARIAALQDELEASPKDDEAWAELGAAYVEQARVTADASYYPRAEGALEKSMRLRPANNDDALTGHGALANARHEFSAAADYAEQAQEINPANSTSWGVSADALVQLGDYEGATAATQRMLDLRPGLASFSRASYDLELHGEHRRAVEALEMALENAYSPADVAFCRYYLGQLTFTSGEVEQAQAQFERGLDAVPEDPLLLAGRARVDASLGREGRAREGYDAVVAARPLPEFLVEYAFYLESLGDTEAADEQFAAFDAVQRIFASNGVQDDLTSAYVAADREQPKVALRHARAEWSARQNVDSADAMAWALHRAGRDTEALDYAVKANRLEGDNALFLYHLGIIEKSLGMKSEAREHLRSALDTNRSFSPWHAPLAEQALHELGGAG